MDLRMMPPNFQLPPPLLLLLAPLQAPARGKPPTELWTRVKRFNPQSSRNHRTSLARKVQKGFENHDMQSKHAVRLRSWKMATSGESMDRKL
jgi:hypothetical protein